MLNLLASDPPPRDHARVRLAEILATLFNEAQRRTPSLRVEDVAREAGVHRVTLQNIVKSAKEGRPRTVDEETFWDVCRVLGEAPEALIAPGVCERVAAWREAMSVGPTEATKRGHKTRPS